jgi:hypothetical protein
MPEVIVTWAGFVLTLMVFSYLLGDNFLYRLAVYAFVGLTAGFVTILTIESVLLPWLRASLESPDVGVQAFGLLPIILGIALIFKVSQRFGALGNLGLALIIGVGASVAVVGAVSGTLLPLANSVTSEIPRAIESAAGMGTAAGGSVGVLNGFLIVVGVVCSLAAFQYAARRVPGAADAALSEQPGRGTRRGLLVRAMSAVGQGFIVVTLGALYGGAILSGVTILSERVAFLLTRLNGG